MLICRAVNPGIFGRAALLALVLASASPALRASDLGDPFPLRNQLPFHLMFLDPSPRPARLLPRRGWRLAWTAAYENTLVATDALVNEFDEPTWAASEGRVSLPVLEQFADPGFGGSGTAFIMDSETLRTVLDAEYGLGSRLEVGIEVPFLMHTGGFLDPMIENWHHNFHLPTGGRDSFARNIFQMGLVSDGEEIFFSEPPGGIGLGDIVLSAGVALLHGGGTSPSVAVSGVVKLPTGSADDLRGSGSYDYGVSILSGWTPGRSSLSGGFSYVRVGPWALAPGLDLRDSRHLWIAYGFDATPDAAIVGQVSATEGPFRTDDANDLGTVSYEIALGMRWRLPRSLQFEAALIENLDRLSNVPDIGAFFGLRYRGGSAESAADSGAGER
jgi:hypothetical protein